VEARRRAIEAVRSTGQAVVEAAERTVEHRWEPARARAARTTAPTLEARVDEVISSFCRELSLVGAATGGAAAAPAVGTFATFSALVAELGWVTMRLSDLILTIAAVHGHTEADVEDRKAWVLSVLAFGDGAHVGFTKLAREVGHGVGRRAVNAIPTSTLRKINLALGRTVVTKYGTKRGVIALGTALPFGIGAAIGGRANYAMARTIGRQADRFFRSLPPPVIDVPVVAPVS
jgi:hypothetical protein